MQNKKLNKKYRNNKLTINNKKYIRNIQLIIFMFDYKKLKYNK